MAAPPSARRSKILIAPPYCEYANGPCDHEMPSATGIHVLFLYPSEPTEIAVAVEAAALKLEQTGTPTLSWQHLKVGGQTIYCEVDKAMRAAQTVVADVTTLNFNLMFEVGYSIGLGLPVLPIRDSSYIKDKRAFAAVGVLDTLGYLDFRNSDQLVDALVTACLKEWVLSRQCSSKRSPAWGSCPANGRRSPARRARHRPLSPDASKGGRSRPAAGRPQGKP